MDAENKTDVGVSGWDRAMNSLRSISIAILCLSLSWSVLRGSRIVIPPAPTAQPAARQTAEVRTREAAAAPLPARPISIDRAKVRGNPSAKAVIVEYSDFQCPYCATFVRNVLPRIETEYVRTGKALFAFHEMPLESIHPLALKAAEAAECAASQNKFWSMHDKLFAAPQQLDEATLRQHAASLGLETKAFGTCLAGQAADRVRAEIQSATELGIDGTPTFLLGTMQADRRVAVTARLSGVQPFERFQTEIERLLASANEARPGLE